MKPRFLLPAALAGVALCALVFWPRADKSGVAPDPQPPVAAAPEPERLRLEHRLADAGAVLRRGSSHEPATRLSPAHVDPRRLLRRSAAAFRQA